MNAIVNEKDIKSLIKKHKIFAEIFRRHKAPPNWSRSQGFVTLARIILEQQVSLASANAHFLRLNEYVKTISPESILKLTDEEMRNCQISRQKSSYLRLLSTAILDRQLDIEQLAGLDEPEVRRQLTSIKGIGNWTADVYLMFCLQAKDIFPIGDIAVVNTMKELTGVATKDEIVLIAEEWKPLRSLATYFLWHYYLEKRGKKNPY
jgi:DNA-3-methyladenine glycosylase II